MAMELSFLSSFAFSFSFFWNNQGAASLHLEEE
jgi:hypothetical protein